MLIGHLGIALALKRTCSNFSLGFLFIAAFLSDFIFSLNLLLGIEKVVLTPAATYFQGVEFSYYPFSHSLLATIVLSVTVYFLIRMALPNSNNKSRFALAMGIGILSHFFLDFIVHNPDLDLLGNGTYMVGIGLWNYPVISTLLEAVILIVGLGIYLKYTTSTGSIGKYGMPIFAIILILINTYSTFSPTPLNVTFFAVQMLVVYGLIVGIAFGIDRKRQSL